MTSSVSDALDGDTREKGVEGPFEHWERDHTSLVHVLWSANHDGLELKGDCDNIASMIFRSRWLAAHDVEVRENARKELLAEIAAAAVDGGDNQAPCLSSTPAPNRS